MNFTEAVHNLGYINLYAGQAAGCFEHWSDKRKADEYGFTGAEAYMFLGQIAEARCTQGVNPKYTYICKVVNEFLR